MTKVPGIDVSRWQRDIDWSLVASAGFRFAAIRATIGNYYTDPRFYLNWDGAREAGLLISAYHVVTVLDVELSRDVHREDITVCVGACAELVEQETQRKPTIYTARWFWDRHVEDGPEWTAYDLWVAHYGVAKPTLPGSWEKWAFWQHSDRGKVPGIAAYTDLDWFNGSFDDLLQYAEREPAEPEVPLEGLSARVAVETLSLRSGPGMNYGEVGVLEKGDRVNIVSLSGEDIWIQVEPGKWAPYRALGNRYMELE